MNVLIKYKQYMSYTKVKSIKFDYKTKQVIIESACSNLFPITYYKEEYQYLSKIWESEGLQAVEAELTLRFWGGDMQKSGNKFYLRGKKLRALFPWGTSAGDKVSEYIKNHY